MVVLLYLHSAVSMVDDFSCISFIPGVFKIRPDKKSDPQVKVMSKFGMIAGGTGKIFE